MAKHCADEHCGSFAARDSEWCRKHGPGQFPPVDWHGVQPEGGYDRGGGLSGPLTEVVNDTDDEPIILSGSREAVRGIELNGKSWQSEAFAHFHDTPPLQPDLSLIRDGQQRRRVAKHRPDQPRRRRTWRHPIRGVIVR